MGKESQLLEAAAAGNNSKVEVGLSNFLDLGVHVCRSKHRRNGVYSQNGHTSLKLCPLVGIALSEKCVQARSVSTIRSVQSLRPSECHS